MSTLDKHMIKELLLVCSALGSIEGSDEHDHQEGSGRFVRGENCLEWLQDLQRALRRDDESTRDICITISSWRVVQQKLIPLLVECRDDSTLVKTLLKIFVMLTMPLSKATASTLGKPVNPKAEGDVRDQQTRRKENAMAQQASLQTFKHAFVSKDVLFAIVGMLEEPLGHVGVARSEDDNFCIELCLTLLRNILSIRDPAPGAVKSPGDQYTEMHGQLLALLQDTLLLDILLLLAQDVHARENASLNLLLVEIFHSIVRDQDPTAVVAECRGKINQDVTGGATKQPSQRRGHGGSLTALLTREKTARGSVSGQMHRFGGTLQVGRDGDAVTRIVANPFKDLVDCVPQAARKKSKKSNAFAPDESGVTVRGASESSTAMRAREILFDFSCSLLKTAYDPFMRSIKNEFRIDSSRLQPEDKGMMFRLMFFFMSFHHQLHQARVRDAIQAGEKSVALPKFELGHVLETMDLMSFNLVLREVETAISEKNTKRVGDCVAVLKEMMHIVALLNESSERAHQMVALGLLARIFYASEPLDKLYDIIRDWQPGKYSRTFLCHLVELVYITLKILEWYKKCEPKVIAGVDEATSASDHLKVLHDKEISDRVQAAKKFDLARYFAKLATNHTLRVYTHLLDHYATNGARTNHYILSFMMRVSSYTYTGRESPKRRRGELYEQRMPGECVGLEAMLYNIHTLRVFQKILDDPLTRKPAFKPLVQYVVSVVGHFGGLARRNHLVFVEALFQHPTPQAFCQTLHDVYFDAVPPVQEDHTRQPRNRKRVRKTGSGDEHDDHDGSYDSNDSHDSDGADEDTGDTAGQVMGMDSESDEEWSEQRKHEGSGPKSDEKDDHHSNRDSSREEEATVTTKRRRGGRKETGCRSPARNEKKSTSHPDSKKHARRWSKEEDTFLRTAYPIYAKDKSVYALLACDDVLEAKNRTEDQIKRRVKKLGLLGKNVSENLHDGDSGDEAPRPAPEGTLLHEVQEKQSLSPREISEPVDSGGEIDPKERAASHVKRSLRRIDRKLPVQGDDSDDMFSSPEDDGTFSSSTETRAQDTAKSSNLSRRAVLEDSDDD